MKEYKVTLKLTEPMLGTVPKDPEIYETYIESKKPQDQKDETPEHESIEKIEEKGWTGFHKDSKGLFLFDYMLRGFMKEAGRTVKDEIGIKQVKSKIDRFVFVFPRRLRILGEDQQGLTEPDGNIQRPLRAMTAQGPRVTIAKSDYVSEDRVIIAQIHVLSSVFTEKALRTILDYGKYSGLGQFRNGSYGRFEHELELVK